jgi:hypothetical protein
MKIIIPFLISILTVGGLWAQPNLTPLELNPQIWDGNTFEQNQALLPPVNCKNPETVTLIPGQKANLCLTPLVTGTLRRSTISLFPTLGTVTLGTNHCFEYTAGSQEGDERFQIKIFDGPVDSCVFTINYRIRKARQLPFFDDFSYEGPYPDKNLWLEKDVFVNRTLVDLAPSVGVASFDGLSSNGLPYGGGLGISDYLTSFPIDLSTKTVNDKVVLSFYAGPKGLGDFPGNGQGFFCQFKTANGTWRQLLKVDPTPGIRPDSSVNPRYIVIKLDSATYLHSNFQFRFYNVSLRNGFADFFNLDYVYLDEDRDPFDRSLEDIALCRDPQGILKRPFRSVPLSQFRNNTNEYLSPELPVLAFNHFDATNNVTNSRITISESTLGNLAGFPFLTQNLNSNVFTSVNRSIPGTDFSSLSTSLNNKAQGQAPLDVKVQYAINITEQSNNPNLSGIVKNDTVIGSTIISDYFAYDDGSPELNVSLNVNNQVAVRYPILTPDSLRAIQFFFPYLDGPASNQLFNLKVWIGNLDATPEFTMTALKPLYPTNTISGITSYSLVNQSTFKPTSLFIPKGDLWIGWQQVTDAIRPIPVGFDLNSRGAESFARYSQSSSGVWSAMPSQFKGAVMIRPVFGQRFTTSSEEVMAIENIQIAPNPSTGTFFIRGEPSIFQGDKTWEIHSLTGQKIAQGILESAQISMNTTPGMYYFTIYSGERKFKKSFPLVVIP